jgi:hypothetical protein
LDADGPKNIGNGGRHDPPLHASREARQTDSSRVGGELLNDLHADARDEGWIAALALLISGLEPVPAFARLPAGLTR